MDEIISTPKHALIVYFPGSGRAGDLNKNLGRIIRRLNEEGNYCVSTMVLTGPESLRTMVADTHADMIVGVGGDGTIRRVLEAVVLSGTKVPVGIIPLGTGNLLAKSLGIVSKGTIDKVENALDVILDGCTAYLDLGKVNDKIFAIDVGVGPLANAVIAPKPGQKSRWKMFAYLGPFIGAMRKRPAHFHVELDGRAMEIQASGIFITNEREMGLTTQPGDLTSLSDGRMYIYIVNPRTFPDWLRVAWATIVGWYTNSSIEFAPYERLVAHHSVRVEADKLSGYMMDGDRCSRPPLEIELLPAAVTIFVPQWAKRSVPVGERQGARRVAV